LTAFSLLSLVIAASLCTGYFCQWMFDCRARQVGNQIPDLELRVGAGRAVLYFREQIVSPATQPLPYWSANWHWRLPDPRRSIWEFDAHRLPMSGATTSWIFACPIWCLLVPCLFVPLKWLRKCPRADPRGFAVLSLPIKQ